MAGDLPKQVKRLNYFTGEYLIDEDFRAEQAYHITMRRLHNSRLHGSGVVDGLEVNVSGGKVTVEPGLALDRDGREIIVAGRLGPFDIPPPANPPKDLFVMVSHVQIPPELPGGKDARVTETAEPKIGDTRGGDAVVLATLKFDAKQQEWRLDRLARSNVSVTKGAIDFGDRYGQFLRASPHTWNIGWGAQQWTVYQRAPALFCWYKDGQHSDIICDPGTNGTTLMWLKSPEAAWQDDPKINRQVTGVLKVANVLGANDAPIGVPVGAIIMWSGDPAKLPSGWVLCDGKNGTPDLRGRFIVGYNSETDPDYGYSIEQKEIKWKKGGAPRVTLKEENLPIFSTSFTVKGQFMNIKTIDVVNGRDLGVVRGWTDDKFLEPKITSDPIGDGESFDARPPYFTLAYIMYTGKA
jgi:hypothetical protein